MNGVGFLVPIVVALSVLVGFMQTSAEASYGVSKSLSRVYPNLDHYLFRVHTAYCVFILIAAATISGPKSFLVVCFVAFLATSMSEVLARVGVLASCNCFGRIGNKYPMGSRLAKYTVLLLSLSTLTMSSTGALSMDYSPEVLAKFRLMFSLLLVGALTWVQLSRMNGAPIDASQKSNAQATAPARLDPNLLLGVDSGGGAITGASYSQSDRPLIIIGLASQCKTCEEAKPGLLALATAFANQVDLLILYDGDLRDLQCPGTTAAPFRLARINDGVFDAWNLGGFPFAGLLNTRNMMWQTSITHAVDRIWMLFYVTTKLTGRKS